MFEVPEEHELVDIKNRMNQTDYDVWLIENGKKKPQAEDHAELIDPRSLGDRTTKIRFKHSHDMQTNTEEDFYSQKKPQNGFSQTKGSFDNRNFLVQDSFTAKPNNTSDESPSFTQGMGTDDFLKTFGNRVNEKSSLLDKIDPNQIRNYLQTQTSQSSGQNDPGLNRFRNMTMYSDDIAAQTINQMTSQPNTENEFYKEALKTGIDSNINSIKNYFA